MENDAFHWGLIDHVLVGLKLSEMSEVARTDHSRDHSTRKTIRGAGAI